ncbi:MAG: winged helix DNA-binding domain-containing protein [Alphaproteobacteria bacterium]|nr:winged helix DNA-binding domain-containing protein [Alphaproteobacteria bacterium]
MTAPLHLTTTDARRAWATHQGLGPVPSAAPLPGGWVRALGGIAAYLALAARRPDLDRPAIDAQVGAGALAVVPGVRGCMWVVPAEDAALSIAAAADAGRRRQERELERVGVDAAEIRGVRDAILAALAGGEHTTDALRTALPDGVVRSLGDAGKKLGMTTTLPPALRLLEMDGLVRRHPLDDRLDHERFAWALAPSGWPGATPDDAASRTRLLVERFLRWRAPASLADLESWTKLSKTALTRALTELDTVEVTVEGEAVARWALADQTVTGLPEDDRPLLLCALDNLFGLAERVGPLLAPEQQAMQVPGMRGKPVVAADTSWLHVRAVVRDGAWVGVWAWDPDAQDVVAATFAPCTPAFRAALAQAAAARAALVRDALDGNARTYSIDNARLRAARAAWVRGRGAAGGTVATP